ncbi:MAG: Cof-type HAD-IIB family hydrolase [Clostridium sp.]
MLKLIASDMDGTLLNNDHKISNYNLQLIKEAQSKGIEFVIATGRQYEDVKPVLDENNLVCDCIVNNGAEFRNKDGEILATINIDKDTVKMILEKIFSAGLAAELYTNEGIFTTNTLEESIVGLAYRLQSFEKGLSFEEAMDKAKEHNYSSKLKFIKNIDLFLNSSIEIRKIITFYYDYDVIKKVKEDISSSMSNLAVLSSFRDNIEITNIKAQKGFILGKVIDNKSISRDDVVVFGDSFNDFSLFTEFENSYAMENAIPEIKEIATFIADTNHNDGVGKCIADLIKDIKITNI